MDRPYGLSLKDLDFRPRFIGIDFLIRTSNDAAVISLKNGEVDEIPWEMDPGYFSDIQTHPETDIMGTSDFGFSYLGFNMRVPAFGYEDYPGSGEKLGTYYGNDTGRLFRRAVAHATEKSYIVNNLLQGYGDVAWSFLSPDNNMYHNLSTDTYPYNLTQSETLLIQQNDIWQTEFPGFPDWNGPEDGWYPIPRRDGSGNIYADTNEFYLLTPTATYDPVMAKAGIKIAETLSDELKINIGAVGQNYQAFVSRLNPGVSDFDIYLHKWDIDEFDSLWQMETIFHSRNDKYGDFNSVGFRNQTYDNITENAENEGNISIKIKKVKYLQGIFSKALPYNPLYYRDEINAYRSEWTGWVDWPAGIWNKYSFSHLEKGGHVSPSVVTKDATSVDETQATLNCDFTIGDYDSVSVSFKWKEGSGSTWNLTSSQNYTSSGSHSDVIEGLQPGTDYEFFGYLEYTNGTKNGTTLDFTTKTSDPLILSTSPKQNSKLAGIASKVRVTFDETMDTGEIPSLTQTNGTDPGGWSFQGWSSSNITDDTATWTHNPWNYGENITLSVSGYVDDDGFVGDPYGWSFWTRAQNDPLRINCNQDFESHAFPGDGSEGDPWVIEGLDIDGTGYGYCIYIGNTTNHFIVRDCYLHHASGSFSWPYRSSSGLTLQNITEGVIEDNNISSNNGEGIYVNMSKNNILIRNNITQNGMNGMLMASSTYSDISNNTFTSNNNIGVALYYSKNNNLMSNDILNNNGGLVLGLESNNNVIEKNNASSNSHDGFQIFRSQNNFIYDNIASNNNGDGFYLSMTNSSLENNTIYSNNENAVDGKECSNNSIKNNSMLGNTNGLYLYESINIDIFNNVISNSSYGIQMDKSSDIFILNNTLEMTNKTIWSITMDTFSEGNTIETNDLTLNRTAYEHRWNEGLIAPYDDPTGISNTSDYFEYLANASFTEFVNVSTNTTFEYHIIGWPDAPDLDLGIYYDNNSDYTAQPEELVEYSADADADEVVTLDYTKPGTYIAKVAGYTVMGTKGHFNRSMILGSAAIRVAGPNQTISGNNIRGFGGGIVCDGSVGNKLTRNNITNTNASIHLSNVNDTSITRNYLNNNSMAINIENSTDNEIYYNNFINNSGHIWSKDNTSYSNIWDDGDGKGNYWDDYGGADDGSGDRTAGDGIGDTEIPHPNTDQGNGYYKLDNYPLMDPADVTPPIISNVSIQDITETTVNISWDTDEPATTTVVYSTNSDLSSNTTYSDVSLVEDHFVILTGLSISTEYYFEVISEDDYGNTVTDDNGSFYYSFETLDLTPPVITSVSTEDINTTSATITWNTDEASDSSVNYSTSSDLTSNTTIYDSTLTIDHSITLTGLSSSQTYYFEVSSADEEGNSATDNNGTNYYQFDTLSVDDVPPMIIDETDSDPNTGDTFTLRANVTDNRGIEGVYVEYRFDGEGWANMSISKEGEFWSYELGVPSDAETLNYIFSAKDTSGNWNTTEENILDVIDNDPPVIIDNSDDSGYTGNRFNFSAEITDNIDIDFVGVEYYFGDDVDNGENTTMEHDGVDTWSLEITVPLNTTETLNYLLRAKDTSDNWEIIEGSARIYDDEDPNVSAGEDVTITEGDSHQFDGSDSYDNIGIASYTWTCSKISGFDLSGMTSNYTFDTAGTYNITLLVQDAADNTGEDSIVVTVEPSSTDTDGDGIDDTWEEEHGLDPNDPSDANDDTDGDGLTNIEEFDMGTDPNDPDSDGDGIEDGEDEDPLNQNEGTEDDKEDKSSFPWWIIAVIAIVMIAVVVMFLLMKRKGEEPADQLQDEKDQAAFERDMDQGKDDAVYGYERQGKIP